MEQKLIVLAIVAFISSTSAQWHEQGRTSCGNCACLQQYKPYCGIDNGRETTYSNLCELECAKKCSPGLRVKFEGVCAEPYKHVEGGSKNNGGNSGTWGSSSFVTTRLPYRSTTSRRELYVPTSTRRPSVGYGPAIQPTERSPYGSGVGYNKPAIQPTQRPIYGGQQWEAGRPTQRTTTGPFRWPQSQGYENGNWREGRDTSEYDNY